MARDDDDDIRLGDPVAAARASHDSDGDGVSDLQERLEGTDPDDASDHLQRDPTIAPREDGDPRGDLDRASLERETALDPTALILEGMSIDTGLTGLKNLDGTDLPTGPDHDGLGEDALLEGRIGANSPLDMERDPLGATEGGSSATSPEGADLSFRAPNPDQYGGYANDVAHAAGTLARDAVNYVKDVAATPGRLYDDFMQSYTEPEETPPPPPPEPPTPPPPPPPPEPWQDGGKKDSTDPDADPSAGTVTAEDVARIVAVERGDTDVVEGYGGRPEIEDDAPPVRYGDLVTDPGEESGDTGATTTDALSGAPDAPVINTINPDSGFVRSPTGGVLGGGGGGDTGLTGESNPATAVVADDPGAPGMTEVGSGGGSGIQSTVADSADDVLGAAPRAATPADAPPPAEVADPGASAVDAFATEYLEDASLAAPDLVAAGLTADLGADPASVVIDDVIDDVALLDPDGADLLEGSLPDADDPDA